MTIQSAENSGTVISFGEVLWDILPDRRILGGAPFNFAFRMFELGRIALIASRLGYDSLGDEAADQIRRSGMDLRLIQRDARRPTGSVNIEFDRNKVAEITVAQDTAYDYVEAQQALMDEAGTALCICYGTVAQRSKVSRATLAMMLDRAPLALKVCDINLRTECYDVATVAESLDRCDLLKLNEGELIEICKMFGISATTPQKMCAEICRRWDINCCLLTLEERGAFACTREGEERYSPGVNVVFADPLGAGDAFTAGFLHQRLKNASIADSLVVGNMLGAIVASQYGATQPILMGELETLVRGDLVRVMDERFKTMSRNEEFVCH